MKQLRFDDPVQLKERLAIGSDDILHEHTSAESTKPWGCGIPSSLNYVDPKRGSLEENYTAGREDIKLYHNQGYVLHNKNYSTIAERA